MVLVENDGFQHFGQLKCAFSKATVSGSPPCERCFSVFVVFVGIFTQSCKEPTWRSRNPTGTASAVVQGLNYQPRLGSEVLA